MLVSMRTVTESTYSLRTTAFCNVFSAVCVCRNCINKEVIAGAVRSVCQRLTSAQHCPDCVARLRANTVQNNKEAIPSVNFERRPHNDNDKRLPHKRSL